MTRAGYKPSGVEWLNDVPEDWDVVPLAAVATEAGRSNKDLHNSNLLSLSYGKIIQKDITQNEGLLPKSFETYQIVEPDSIVFRFTDMQNDHKSLRSGIVRERGIITSAYLNIQPRGCDTEYLAALMRVYDLHKVFYSMGSGMRQNLKFSDLKHLPVLLPPKPEQRRIVDYLNRETPEIDELVATQQRLITQLEERRRAVISQAVTRGLDPDTLLKPSGIDWAPSIPSSWQAIPLKFVLRESQELVGARTDYVPLSVSEFHGVVPSTEDISFKRGNEVSQYRVVHKNELAVNTMWLNHTGLGVSAYEGYVSPAYRSYQLITDSSPRYIHYLMRSHTYVNAYSGAIRGLRPNSLQMPSSEWGRWPILRPPLAEQRRIAAYLDGVTAAIDETVRVARHAIELARERRQTLISEVVTGRRRV